MRFAIKVVHVILVKLVTSLRLEEVIIKIAVGGRGGGVLRVDCEGEIAVRVPASRSKRAV